MSEFPSPLRLDNVPLYPWSTFCLSIHLFMDRQFELWCMDIWVPVFSSFSYIPRSRIAGSYLTLCLTFWETAKLFPIEATLFTFPPAKHKGSICSTFLPTLVIFCGFFFFSHLEKSESELCPTLCDPMDYTIHGILQARILEWVAFPFSRGSSQPRDGTQVSHIAGRFFTSWATREAREYWSG